MVNEFVILKDWLHLTNQQYLVLRSIVELQGTPNCKPKEIEEKFKEMSNKHIQKTNLFGLLKLLMDRDYLVKDEKMNYRVNVEAIKGKLQVERNKLKSEDEELAGYLENPNRLLSGLDSGYNEDIITKLITKKEFYSKISSKLNIYMDYCNISRFPSLFFTETISKRLGRDKYIDVMGKKCFTEKNLNMSYLTNLNVERIYNHTKKIFANKKDAIKEVLLVIDRFELLVKNNKNLHVYYSENKPDWEYIIPYSGFPKEFFLILRSKNIEDSPGILHIISRDAAQKAFDIFAKRINRAEEITKTSVGKHIKRLKKETLSL